MIFSLTAKTLTETFTLKDKSSKAFTLVDFPQLSSLVGTFDPLKHRYLQQTHADYKYILPLQPSISVSFDSFIPDSNPEQYRAQMCTSFLPALF